MPDGEVPSYSLLVGVDGYPARVESGPVYPPLAGAVHDVERMERLLTRGFGVARDRVHKLVAPAEPAGTPRDGAPTYERMVAGFEWLLEKAAPGDAVLFYFSGHGGRARTCRPDLKGTEGLDEVLVPADLQEPDGRYLRDFEIGFWITRFVDRGVFPTLILDACHSGGASRDRRRPRPDRVRGVRAIDESRRSHRSLAASAASLAAAWQRLAAPAGRAEPGSGWLPRPRGYVLLAACAAPELSYERDFADWGQHGIFSHWLLRGLETLGTRLSYRQLYERIYPRVRNEVEDQTPQLEGEADRLVFGGGSRETWKTTFVLQADPDLVLLDAGRAQGIREGDRFVVFRESEQAGSGVAALAEVEVSDAAAARSWAEYRRRSEHPAEVGDRAAWIESGSRRRRCTVAIAAPPGAGPEVARLARTLRDGARGFLALAEAAEPAPDFRVLVDAGARARVLVEEAGQIVGDWLFPLAEPAACERLVSTLVHCAKLRNVAAVENPDRLCPLRGKLRLTARRTDGRLETEVENLSPMGLRLAALFLGADWSVSQVHPASESGLYTVPLEPGRAERFSLDLAPAAAGGTAPMQVMAFATVEAANFRWLELPPLPSSGRIDSAFRGRPLNSLETILAALLADASGSLRAPVAPVEWDWTVERLRVQA